MTKQAFSASVKEDLNRLHTVTLTEGQIATILYVMEDASSSCDTADEQDQFDRDVDAIFASLEGKVDEYYSLSDS